jgi:hypothetical protein
LLSAIRQFARCIDHGGFAMRLLTSFAVIVAALSFSAGNASAEPYYPWCARYNNWTIVCGFATWQQCQATVSGVGGFCQQNVMPPPAGAWTGQQQGRRSHHKRRHHSRR